ncbi:glyoxalase/bleomycin resistance/extradiol dioxygenase family protein [Tessaracoccus terricola]
MPVTTTPYIEFPGTAAVAMKFYQSVFGGELEVMGYEGIDTSEFPVPPAPDAVAHASLTGGSLDIRAGDAVAEEPAGTASDVYSMMILTDTVAEGEELIEKFVAAGGTVELPFEPAPWGDVYGQVRDPFGVMWQVDTEAPQE